MTSVLLYWNHICVLHKQEKLFLEQISKKLLQENIHLDIRYFGLGYPKHMSEYLAAPDAVIPDMIISSDLEVFEDPRIFHKFSDSLYDVSDWIPLHQGAALDAIRRDKTLLPFLAIPLVYYTDESDTYEGQAIHDIQNLAFGGINNSAAKTVVKAVWSYYGKEVAQELLTRSDISQMPIAAFQKVRLKERKIALVPSLYALRADDRTSFLRIPKEGPLLIPSFCCARNSLTEEIARKVVQSILCNELCDFYAKNGDLIVFPSSEHQNHRQSQKYLTPSPEWLQKTSPEEFYEVYLNALPSAQEPFANTGYSCQ